MTKQTLLKMTLILGLLTFATVAFSQKRNTNSELATFLKDKNYVTIPLKKFPSGHLYLTLQINDSTGIFILDTGVGGTVYLEEKRVQKYNLKAEAIAEKATGVGGSEINMQSALVHKLRIGQCNFDNTDISLMNLDHVNNAFKQIGQEGVDGLIGANILTKGHAIIDYTNLVLYLKK